MAGAQGGHPFLDHRHHHGPFKLEHLEVAVVMELKDKKVVVVGLGRSGQASARLLAFLGAEVWVTDRRSSQELAQEITTLKDQPVRFSLGGHPASVFSGAALAVVSPGVAPRGPPRWFGPILGEGALA